MKTKEEIVKWHTHNLSAFSLATYKKPVYDAMQEYADQECAEKDNEISRLNGIITEQQRLSNLVSGDLQNAKKDIQELREVGKALILELNDEVIRLRAEVERLNLIVSNSIGFKAMKIKRKKVSDYDGSRELTAEEWYKERDSMTDLALKQSQIKTIEELRKEIESLRNEKNNELARLTAPDGSITKRVLIEDNHRLTSENEQLRKENEEWKKRQEYLEDEITRLRELLERAKDWIYDNASEESSANDERAKLLADIEKELNPKP